MHPVKAKEFFEATDDKSIPLADFLRQLQMTDNIYGDDTDMINGLTSNTTKHEKNKLKVCMYVCLSGCDTMMLLSCLVVCPSYLYIYVITCLTFYPHPQLDFDSIFIDGGPFLRVPSVQ